MLFTFADKMSTYAKSRTKTWLTFGNALQIAQNLFKKKNNDKYDNLWVVNFIVLILRLMSVGGPKVKKVWKVWNVEMSDKIIPYNLYIFYKAYTFMATSFRKRGQDL